MLVKALLLAVATCSVLELQDAVCNALCRKDGYDEGSFRLKAKSCLCQNVIPYAEATEKTLTIRLRRRAVDAPAPPVPGAE